MKSTNLTASGACRNLVFIVEKPAQFDVPLFRYIAASHQEKWHFVVVYLQAPAADHHDIELLTRSDWGINLTEGYEWHYLPLVNEESIKNLFVSLQPAVIISNGYKAGYAPYLSVARSLKIPLGLRIDSVLFGEPILKLVARKLLMRFTYRQFSMFLTTGKVGEKYLAFIGIAASKTGWFPYCTDNDFFRHPQRLPAFEISFKPKQRSNVIISLCKFNKRENPMELLAAFCSINNAALQLIMIGDGPLMPELVAYAARYSHLSIHFPGFVPYLQLPGWYHMAAVFVHTARHEPWGVSVQEALAAGCRIVASDRVGSAFDLVVSGENGFVYPLKNGAKLVDCINDALSIPVEKFNRTTSKLLNEQWNYQFVWNALQKAAEKMAG